MYKTFVIDYNPKTRSMAKIIKEKANEPEHSWYEVISFAMTPSAKGIILVKEKTCRKV